MSAPDNPKFTDRDTTFDLDALLHPALAFGHPREVVDDPDLTLNEKRAILAAWASDACAVKDLPALRMTPHGGTVGFDEIVDALRLLDKEAERARFRPKSRIKRTLRAWRRAPDDSGGLGLQ